MRKPLLARTLEQLTNIPAVWVVVSVWMFIIVAVYGYLVAHDITLKDTLLALFTFLSTNSWAPLIYIVIYTLQPFAFLPSTVFTLLAGSIFGFWPGIFYTLIGANLSAAAVYITGRFLARPLPEESHRMARWIRPLRTQTFETVLFMRLVYVPFDVVNILSGILKLRFLPFILGTAIGIIPGMATITSLGTSVNLQDFFERGISLGAIDGMALVYSALLFVVSITIANFVRKRHDRKLTTNTKNEH